MRNIDWPGEPLVTGRGPQRTMRILEISDPVTVIPFLNAGRGRGDFYVDQLPIHEALVDRLPDGIQAIVAAADLQGRERFQDSLGGPLRLLGEILPDRLRDEVLASRGVSPDQSGVLLAGDFYTVPDLSRRGGTGDVTAIWQAFADEFAWVAGVAGNHDMFGDSHDRVPRLTECCHYLDGESVNIGGSLIAGIGGIVGNPRRPRRRSQDDYLAALDSLLQRKPEVVLMHDGPDADGPSFRFRGSAAIREMIERHGPRLVVRGHAHWSQPLVELARGVQVLNVDARVVILSQKSR